MAFFHILVLALGPIRHLRRWVRRVDLVMCSVTICSQAQRRRPARFSSSRDRTYRRNNYLVSMERARHSNCREGWLHYPKASNQY